MWSTQTVTEYVNREFGTEYTPAGVRRLLHRNGYEFVSTRSADYKASTKAGRNSKAKPMLHYMVRKKA